MGNNANIGVQGGLGLGCLGFCFRLVSYGRSESTPQKKGSPFFSIHQLYWSLLSADLPELIPSFWEATCHLSS